MRMPSRALPAARSLRVLARLLSYPDAKLRAHLGEMREALHAEAALAPARLAELDRLIDALGTPGALEVQAGYVQTFDRGRATSLYLFEHVHGDSRERGPAMIELAQTYEQGGLCLAPGELPDYLPVVLEFASTRPPREARQFLGETAHILNALSSALQQRRSAYAAAIGAVLELAGEKVQPVAPPPEPPLDESWTEPAAFDGCGSGGRARPDEPRPIHIVRRATGVEGVSS